MPERIDHYIKDEERLAVNIRWCRLRPKVARSSEQLK
jgi:hypothetical protein